MNINPEVFKIIDRLDNPKSVLNTVEFKEFREELIKSITTKYWVDSFGEVVTRC